MTKAGKKPALKPWEQRPSPQKGDPDADITYAAVGRALSAWEHFEASLALLFSVIIGDADRLVSLRAYCSIRTFEGRCEMIKAASTAYFALTPDKELQSEFVDLIKRAKNFAPRRNEIAHGIVAIFGLKGANTFEDLRNFNGPGQFCLVPSYASALEKRDLDFAALYCYCAPDLRFYEGHFASLDIRAYTLAQRMFTARQASGGKHQEPSPVQASH